MIVRLPKIADQSFPTSVLLTSFSYSILPGYDSAS